VLRKIFGPQRQEVTETGENYIILCLIKSRKMRLVGHEIQWAKLEMYKLFVGQLEERDHSGDIGKDGNVFNEAVNN
jgi:uncharacterized membrane protein YqhA